MTVTKKKILELIEKKDFKLAKRSLNDLEVNEIAQELDNVPKLKKIILFRLLTREPKQAPKLLRDTPPKRLKFLSNLVVHELSRLGDSSFRQLPL